MGIRNCGICGQLIASKYNPKKYHIQCKQEEIMAKLKEHIKQEGRPPLHGTPLSRECYYWFGLSPYGVLLEDGMKKEE